MKFATKEAAITLLWIDDLIKLHLESKGDEHWGYENDVHSRALGDWPDSSFIYNTVRCNCLIPCILHINIQATVKKNTTRILRKETEWYQKTLYDCTLEIDWIFCWIGTPQELETEETKAPRQESTWGTEKWKYNVCGVYKRKSQEIMVESK